MVRAKRQSTAGPVADWASELPARFLACRDMGHAWQPFTAAWIPNQRQYQRVLRCSRCRTERIQYLSTTGQIESGSYVYPDGYAMPHGAGGYDQAARNLCHLANITRLIAHARELAS